MSLTHSNSSDLHRETSENPPREHHAEVSKALNILFAEGAVVELRAFGLFGDVVSGFYADREALSWEAVALDSCGYQVYVTLNEVDPALLERAANKTTGYATGKPMGATTDRDIIRRRWLFVDVDPVRPPDESATREEKGAAHLKAKEVRDYLRGQGWPRPVIADSGNGFHLLFALDLPNDEKSRELVKAVLHALASRFDDPSVKIDPSVHNASRLIRVYGTLNSKGHKTPERPHRRSKIIKTPEEVA
jgi:hypothetical protein